MFDKPLSETLIRDIKNILPAISNYCKAFELEPKDVPYIVASFSIIRALLQSI